MLRPPQSHAAPTTRSGQLRLLQHRSPKSQFLPIPGARLPPGRAAAFPACRAGFAAAPSLAEWGVFNRFHPNFLQARAWGWGGGCKIAPSEVPPAQSFLFPGIKPRSGFWGIANTKDQL